MRNIASLFPPPFYGGGAERSEAEGVAAHPKILLHLRRPLHRFAVPLPRKAGEENHGTGVQITSLKFRAPAASITRRSKPSATPLDGGICASAARKSSSIG